MMRSSNAQRPGLLGTMLRLVRWSAALGIFALVAAFTAAPFLSPYSAKADLATQFLLQGSVFTALALLVAVLRRHWRAGAALAACFALQLFVIQPPITPRPAEAGHDTLRLVFANVWARNDARPQAVEVLKGLDADILVMAEFVDGWDADGRSMTADYAERADCGERPGCDVVVLSRFPIESRLAPEHKKHFSTVLARIATPLGPLDVIGAHVVQPLPLGRVHLQEQHAQLLRDLAAGRDRPVVMVGDFNAVPWGRIIQTIEAGTDLRAARGLEGTWHADLPWPMRIPIDHVLVGPDLQIARREVIDVPGSDHKGVLVELRRTGA
ncbi:MAG: endonuclease/exonuclease/phosphatase family protein [Geminicoccaceae bacterium]|nr:endonuclease/exonuclease/phosphatase family protein [Geminicoccaceae bacterium]